VAEFAVVRRERDELPTGTVSFLFTAVEDSTRLPLVLTGVDDHGRRAAGAEGMSDTTVEIGAPHWLCPRDGSLPRS
jgi:hypothetical protein